uniref:Uncharacterized protein n=1 Tax=Panagrolaimus sp. ES5 TaxID=591445 RepID=A0AC34GBW5_9BILA
SLFDAADSCILDDPKLNGFGNRFKNSNDGADKAATVNNENGAADMKVEENKSKAVDQVKEEKSVEIVADNDKVQFLSNEVSPDDPNKPLASVSGDNFEKLVDADKKEDEKPAEVDSDSVIVVAQNNASEQDPKLGDSSGQSTQDVAVIVADKEVQPPSESKQSTAAEQSANVENAEKMDISSATLDQKEAALKMLRFLQQSGHQIPQSAFDIFNESGARFEDTVATNFNTENAKQASSADFNQEVEVQEDKEDKNAGPVNDVADKKVESSPPTVPVDEMKADEEDSFPKNDYDVKKPYPSIKTAVDEEDDGW